MGSGIINHAPVIGRILRRLIPKFLDFSDYPYVKGSLAKIERERDIAIKRTIDTKKIDLWHITILKYLLNFQPLEVNLSRIGPYSDGGYMVPDEYTKGQLWITIGLGYNWGFEETLLALGSCIHSFDHTLSLRPSGLPSGIKWHKLGVKASSQEASENDVRDVKELQQLIPNGSIMPWNLKMDIEGHEWGVFTDICQLNNPPQVIVCELHNLLFSENEQMLMEVQKELILLLSRYTIVHCGGNNFSAYICTPEYALYDVVEVTLIRTDLLGSPKLNKGAISKPFSTVIPNDPKSINPPMYLNKVF